MVKKEENPFEIDFDSYIRQGEPDKKEKSIAWAIATGLQQVDGLTPSKYLYETARRNIEGEITIAEAKNLIDSYYESKSIRTEEDDDKDEADKVSARITELLSEKSFSFAPNQLVSIHERLFKGVFYKVKAGKYRDYNITKKEWVLDGDTVLYANADLISETLKYDFETEKNFDYSKLTPEDAVKHLTRFIANIWQIHPFGEGNTRTTAVFTIKYLKSLGFNVDNEPFEKNSWYFRNALVRANYTNMQKGIYMNTEYLERFFRNLLLSEHNELKNRYTHIRYDEYMKTYSGSVGTKDNVKSHESHSKITESLTQIQQKILEEISKNKYISQTDLAAQLSITRETINRNMKKLQNQGIIRRIGADKNGHWEILE
ncbi:MAG: Fic family protein [Spirochaetaceae bacterium]|nr:Fic family protein [Spirochaetaceae bacterium]